MKHDNLEQAPEHQRIDLPESVAANGRGADDATGVTRAPTFSGARHV